VATFPDDGLTSGAIIAAVHGAALEEVPIPLRASVADPIDATDDQVAGEKVAQS